MQTASLESFIISERQSTAQRTAETATVAAAAALGVMSTPMAANKGTTKPRLIAGRDCRWATFDPDPTQFVYVFEVGGSASTGARVSTLTLQVVVAAAAAACARVRRFQQVAVLHLAVFSYYGPNVAALATAMAKGEWPSRCPLSDSS